MRTLAARRRPNREDAEGRAVSVGDLLPVPPKRKRVRARGAEHAAMDKEPERFGPFNVFEPLGEGGMATVHRAERVGIEGFRKPIALKRLYTDLADDRDFVEGFVQEGRLACLLKHGNIAQAYELGRIDDTYYIAMEYVPGPTLQEVMIQSRTACGAVPHELVVEILLQLCDALDHAHDLRDEKGRPLKLVHRDISPANIIVSLSGVVKLIDFGIAKAARSRVHTQVGYIKGKLAYVAPEYTRGQLDHRADLFAVGVIAHEILTGHRLFRGSNDVSIVGKIRELPIHPPSYYDPTVSHDLDDIVMLALQRDPDKRWQNAGAMRNALVNVAHELGDRLTGRRIRAWIEWAFSKEPWRASFLDTTLKTFTPTGGEKFALSVMPATRATPPGSPFEVVVAPPRARDATSIESPGARDDVMRVRARSSRDDLTSMVLGALAADAVVEESSTPTPRSMGTQVIQRKRPDLSPGLVLLLLATLVAVAVWTGWLPAALAAI